MEITINGEKQTLEVVRVGVFNAVADGSFLDWDTSKSRENLIELARQPAQRFRGMAGSLLVPYEDVLNVILLDDFVIDRQHGASGIPEEVLDPVIPQRLNDHCRSGHLHRHVITPLVDSSAFSQ